MSLQQCRPEQEVVPTERQEHGLDRTLEACRDVDSRKPAPDMFDDCVSYDTREQLRGVEKVVVPLEWRECLSAPMSACLPEARKLIVRYATVILN